MESRNNRAIAVISVHASPVAALGEGENGGMNLAIRRLCEQLAALDVPSDVFTRRDDPNLPDEQLIAGGSRLIRLPVGPAAPLPKEAVAALMPEFAAQVLAHATSEQRRYRLIHAHYWLSGLVAETLAPLWGAPWVQSFHTLAATKVSPDMPPPHRQRLDAETRIAQRATRIIASSRGEKADIARATGARADKICLVPLGVDLADYAPHDATPYRERLGLEGRRVIAYAGRLERLKGVDLLLGAFAALRLTGRYNDAVLLIAGGDSHDGARESVATGGELGRLEVLARRLGVAADTRFLGALRGQDLADLFALADVVVVPSRTESFGLVALEALATGTPVVTAAVGGLRDIVEDGVTGYLVEQRTPSAFAASISAVLDDRTLAGRMSVDGRARAEQFTWGRSARRLANIFDRMTTPGRELENPCGEPEPCPE